MKVSESKLTEQEKAKAQFIKEGGEEVNDENKEDSDINKGITEIKLMIQSIYENNFVYENRMSVVQGGFGSLRREKSVI